MKSFVIGLLWFFNQLSYLFPLMEPHGFFNFTRGVRVILSILFFFVWLKMYWARVSPNWLLRANLILSKALEESVFRHTHFMQIIWWYSTKVWYGFLLFCITKFGRYNFIEKRLYWCILLYGEFSHISYSHLYRAT
jgi:hypothetical protein